jgi:hypothetical protein
MSAKKIDKSDSEKKRSAKSYSSAKSETKKTTAKPAGAYSKKMLNAISLSQEEINKLIASKAYELYESRGYQHGHDLEDWVRAEKLVLQQAK